MPDWELEQLRQVYELSGGVLEQYHYRKALLDRGYGVKEAGLRVGDIVEVDESLSGAPRQYYWIQDPLPWIGEIMGAIKLPENRAERENMLFYPRFWYTPREEEVAWLEKINNGVPETLRLYDLQEEVPYITPLMPAEPSPWAINDWGLSAITPRSTSFQITVPQIKLLDPFNPLAPSQPPVVVRCPNCNLRLLGFLYTHQGRKCCAKCLQPLWKE